MAFACFHPESCGLKREVVLLFEGVSAEFARLSVFSANVDGFRNEKKEMFPVQGRGQSCRYKCPLSN
jgi:hypothetical protein